MSTHDDSCSGEKTLAGIDGMAAEESPLRYELQNALAEVSAAARALRQMVDYLGRHPEALLYGIMQLQRKIRRVGTIERRFP